MNDNPLNMLGYKTYVNKINFICSFLILYEMIKITLLIHILFLLDSANVRHIRKSMQNIGCSLCHSIAQRSITGTKTLKLFSHCLTIDFCL